MVSQSAIREVGTGSPAAPWLKSMRNVTRSSSLCAGKSPLAGQFTGFGTDLDGQVVSYRWDFDDGSGEI